VQHSFLLPVFTVKVRAGVSFSLLALHEWCLGNRTGKAEQTGKNRGISPYRVPSFFLQDRRGVGKAGGGVGC